MTLDTCFKNLILEQEKGNGNLNVYS